MKKKPTRGVNRFAFIPSILMLVTSPIWLLAVLDFLDSFLPHSPTWRVIEFTFIGLMAIFVEHAVAEVFGGTLPAVGSIERDFRRFQLKWVLGFLLLGVILMFGVQIDRINALIKEASPLLNSIFGPPAVNYFARNPGILLFVVFGLAFVVYQIQWNRDAKLDRQDELAEAEERRAYLQQFMAKDDKPKTSSDVWVFVILAVMLGAAAWIVLSK